MTDEELNKNLDKYISQRRASGYSPAVDKKIELTKEQEAELKMAKADRTVVIEKVPWWKKVFIKEPVKEEEFKEELEEELTGEIKEELEEIDKEEDNIEERRTGIIGAFIDKLKFIYGSKTRDKDFSGEEALEEIEYSEKPIKVEVYKTRANKEIKEVMIVMDKLLQSLPRGVKEEFAKTKDYELYKHVFKKYGIKSGTAIDEFELKK